MCVLILLKIHFNGPDKSWWMSFLQCHWLFSSSKSVDHFILCSRFNKPNNFHIVHRFCSTQQCLKKLIRNFPVFCFVYLFTEAFSLQLTKVVIPPYKFHGETALLECQYELNSNKNHNNNRNYHSRYNNNKDYGYRSIHSSISDDNNGIDHLHNGGGSSSSGSTTSDEEETLYSVKWYKDNEEFYRYVPRSNPPQQSYRVEGIRVDVSIFLL